MSQIFQGSFVAMVTPFRNGKVDEAKLKELVEFHVSSGTDGLIPCGTTGESRRSATTSTTAWSSS